jgi:uncharacterized protein YpuA (DUF1002 family)
MKKSSLPSAVIIMPHCQGARPLRGGSAALDYVWYNDGADRQKKGENKMTTYKLNLTENQRNKLTVFILQYKEKAAEASQLWRELAEEKNNWTDEQRQTFSNNADYYAEMYQELNTIRHALDEIPF